MLLFFNACVSDSDSNQSSVPSTDPPPETTAPLISACELSSKDPETLQFNSTINSGDTSTDIPLLIVRVEFSDVLLTSPAVVWQNKFFGIQDGEMNEYFREISNKQFQFFPAAETDGAADGIVTATLDLAHPNPLLYSSGIEISRYQSIVTKALVEVDTFVDFSSFDNKPEDGKIDQDELQVIFLVAGYEGAYSGESSYSVWAHQYCIQGGLSHDNITLVGCGSNGGNNYSMFGECHDKHDATIGVIAHELGHAAFNLPDLYDRDGDAQGIGKFGLMGAGSWTWSNSDNYAGERPTHMSAWSKIKSNFAVATDISPDTNATFALHDTKALNYNILKVPINSSEYFLLENRAGRGYDRGFDTLSGLKGNFQGGIAIWHIDESMDNNDDQNRKLVDLEEANNFGLDSDFSVDSNAHQGHINNLYFYRNATEFSEFTTPDSKDNSGDLSGVTLSNISAVGVDASIDVSVDTHP